MRDVWVICSEREHKPVVRAVAHDAREAERTLERWRHRLPDDTKTWMAEVPEEVMEPWLQHQEA